MRIKLSIYFLLTCSVFVGLGQWSSQELVKRIASFQVEKDFFYDPGLFPSQRTWSLSKDTVQDNTIFFTAAIASTLRSIYPQCDSSTQLAIDQILSNAERMYEKYRSRNGEPTYNFWQTVPPDLPFPNGSKLLNRKGMRLPDDYNTSVLVAMARNKNDSMDQLLRNRMISYAMRIERADKKISTLDTYREYNAYEIWFGKDMPQTFDLNVLSNILWFVFDRNYELTPTDFESIELIKKMVINRDYIHQPTEISYYTDSPPLILYHLTRMITLDNQGLFDGIGKGIIQDLQTLLETTENEFEKVLILSSLMRINQSQDTKIDLAKLENHLNNFISFSAKPLGRAYNSMDLEGISPIVDWFSEAYNLTLVFEYLVLSEQHK